VIIRSIPAESESEEKLVGPSASADLPKENERAHAGIQIQKCNPFA
jgi:hypothetical protein